MKTNLNAALHEDLARALDIEIANMVRTTATEDAKEAGRAMMEKRKPGFKGY